ncbi:MAG TPA: energy-coupling factor ABC transporter ATP-binding protein, partial [Ardenticatenaceae bacterium]
QRSALRPVESLAAQWPFAPPRSPAPLPSIPPVPPVPVTVESLRYTYPNGVEALRGVSLRLEPGRIAALIGSNGAGKSTLSRSLNGLLRPAAGTVLAGDWNTAEHPTSELARRVGYLFQNPDEQLFKSTVEAEVAFGPRNLGFTEEEVEEAVAFALSLTGLTELADEHPYDLHPTQRRWVALASVLAMRSPVLILDEPTTGLDLAGKEQMAALLLALKEAGYTLLLVSHDMQFVAEYTDTVYVMAEGQVIAQGTPASVFADDEALHRADVTVAPVARLARALNFGTDVVAAGQFVAAALREPDSPSPATNDNPKP